MVKWTKSTCYVLLISHGRNGRCFAGNIFRCIFVNEKFCISTCTKNIKQDIKITRDYVQTKIILPQNILRILYNSLILPHLQYCILSWGFKSDKIFKLQKKAVRIIACSKYNAHTEPLLKTLNLLKIEDIMKTKALKLYHRYKRNELPKYFESMFTESNDNHSHDTRHKSLLYQLPTKTCTGRLCIRHYIPELLTKTPECITDKLDTHSFSGFFKLYEKLLHSEL